MMEKGFSALERDIRSQHSKAEEPRSACNRGSIEWMFVNAQA